MTHPTRSLTRTILAIVLGLIAVLGAAPAPAQAVCSTAVSFHGYTGHKICGTGSAFVRFNDGTERMFVIGLDSAVWNIVYYRSSGYVSGWRSLGGNAHGWVRVSAKLADPSWFDIYVIGANNAYWNKRWAYGWMDWRQSSWAPGQACLCT